MPVRKKNTEEKSEEKKIILPYIKVTIDKIENIIRKENIKTVFITEEAIN